MRPVRGITAEEQNERVEPVEGTAVCVIRRKPVEPEPIGTIVLKAFRVAGYDPDCDGSLMARLENIEKDGSFTGWDPTHLSLYPENALVVDANEWATMFEQPRANDAVAR